ncbi:MAG: hypothetical protein K2J77_13260, partial [Oscillospiraceae bacterium]|nr:hypothetical protein [Oscillospiraceae bacterium]
MSDLVKEIMGNFIALSQEEKNISAENDAAFKEYNAYCADSEKDLNEKIEEIHKKMAKLDYYLDYAREHGSDLEEAPEAFDTPDGTLESIRQTIKLDSTDDPNAGTLYIKATGKKKFYEQEIERVRKLVEGSKVQAKRQLDSETAKLNSRKSEHFEKVRAYVQSDEFAEYLKILVYDKSAFNSPGTVNLGDDGLISLGQRRVKLSVPMDIEQDIALSSNGEYNAAAHTIGAPYRVSAKKGGTLFLEHDERNGQYLLGGIQRLLLNFIKYFGSDITHVVFCEPNRFSVDCLGNIAALGKGLNPFITVPKSKEEIEGKVNRLAARAAEAPTPDKVSRILVMQNFPEKYSPELAEKILEICKNAEKNGVLVVLTHDVSIESTSLEAEVRALSEVIRSRNGGFWLERERESLFWYSAPSDISDEVRKVYVEKRNQDALKAAQEPEAASVPAPAPVEVKPVEAPKPAPAPAPVEAKPVEVPKPAPAPVAEQKPVEAPKPAPAAKPAPVRQPNSADREVVMTVLSEIDEPLPPPALDPFEALNVPRPKQEIDPEFTYRITDRQSAAPASPFAPAAPAAPVESTPIDPNAMTYKITDHPDKVARLNEEHPAPQTPERTTPIVQHQTAAREPYEVTPDMTYRITDKTQPGASAAPVAPAAPSAPVDPNAMTYKITDHPDKVDSMNREH